MRLRVIEERNRFRNRHPGDRPGLRVDNAVDQPERRQFSAVGQRAVGAEHLKRRNTHAVSDGEPGDRKPVPAADRRQKPPSLQRKRQTRLRPEPEQSQRVIDPLFTEHHRHLRRADVTGFLDHPGNRQLVVGVGVAQHLPEVDPRALVAIDHRIRRDHPPVERLADGEGLDDRTGFDTILGDAGAGRRRTESGAVVRIEGRALCNGEDVSGLRIGDRRVECRRLPLGIGRVELLLQNRLNRFPDGEIDVLSIPALLDEFVESVGERQSVERAFVTLPPGVAGHLPVQLFFQTDLRHVAVVDDVGVAEHVGKHRPLGIGPHVAIAEKERVDPVHPDLFPDLRSLIERRTLFDHRVTGGHHHRGAIRIGQRLPFRPPLDTQRIEPLVEIVVVAAEMFGENERQFPPLRLPGQIAGIGGDGDAGTVADQQVPRHVEDLPALAAGDAGGGVPGPGLLQIFRMGFHLHDVEPGDQVTRHRHQQQSSRKLHAEADAVIAAQHGQNPANLEPRPPVNCAPCSAGVRAPEPQWLPIPAACGPPVPEREWRSC